MTTILSTLRDTAQQQGRELAIYEDARQWTYADLYQDVLRGAEVLRRRGLEHGDRYAIWAPNCAEWIIAALAGQALGAILVPLNTRFKSNEAMDILRRASARFLFTVKGFLDTDYAAMLDRSQLPDLADIIIMHDGHTSHIEAFLSGGEARDELSVNSQDISDIIYTSGTTGQSKGVMTTHEQNVKVFDAFTRAIDLQATDRYLVINPFFHSFGYKAGWLSCLIRGAAIFPQATFDPEAVMQQIATHNISVMPGAPTIFQTLLAHPARPNYNLSSLRVATTGATTIPVDLIRRMHEDLGIDNVYSAYGLTESSGVVTLCQRGDDFSTIATTCGRALPGTELRIVDDAGQDAHSGEEGEIWVRGFNVMAGYFDDPVATSEAITDDGWLKTGDIGTCDPDGYIKITDRKKDMIIVGGFNCYPAEIEKYLLTHPSVADVAVIAMPDERLGEVPQAFIVPAKAVEVDEIMNFARQSLANFKVPRRIQFVDELPRNASGKVVKYMLLDG